MKLIGGIIIIIGIFISQSVLCQDTSHTKLVDKFYPKPANSSPVPENKVSTEVTPISSGAQIDNSPLQQNTTIKNNTVNKPVITNPNKTPESSVNNAPNPVITPPVTNPVYVDTHLGSSSPQYDTYIKNDSGAGAITTNPNKNSGSNISTPVTPSANVEPIYNPNRLGSSSPLYNTYQKNDSGAGSVTTNPNKG